MTRVTAAAMKVGKSPRNMTAGLYHPAFVAPRAAEVYFAWPPRGSASLLYEVPMGAGGRRRKPPRLLYSHAGGGHVAAALAIREALESSYPGRYRVELLDALSEYAPRPLSYAPQPSPALTNFPRLWRL